MDGHRHAVTSADGTEIGLLTAGGGPPPWTGAAGAPAATPRRTGRTRSSRTSRRPRPAWAREVTGELAAILPRGTLAVLDGQGHDAIGFAPAELMGALGGFFS